MPPQKRRLSPEEVERLRALAGVPSPGRPPKVDDPAVVQRVTELARAGCRDHEIAHLLGPDWTHKQVSSLRYRNKIAAGARRGRPPKSGRKDPLRQVQTSSR